MVSQQRQSIPHRNLLLGYMLIYRSSIIISDSKYRGQCCVIHSDKHMEALLTPVLVRMVWKVNIGGQVSNHSRPMSYGPPVVRLEEVYVNIQRFKTRVATLLILQENYGPDMETI